MFKLTIGHAFIYGALFWLGLAGVGCYLLT